MAEQWVTSDTHFGHRQILTWRDNAGALQRGSRFSSAEEMNEVLIANWNSCVAPSDIVWHLGDVHLMFFDDFAPLWSRLNGRKMLVLGNHDDASAFARRGLVEDIVLFKRMHKLGLVLSHVPMRDEGRYGLHNVHGHLHYLPAPTPQHTCVSVEQTDYSPVNLQVLSAAAQQEES